MTHVYVHGAGAFLRKAEGCRLPTKEITSPTGRSHPASSTFSSFSFAFAFSFAFTFLSFALTFLLFGFSGFAILKLCQKPGFLVCLKLTKGKNVWLRHTLHDVFFHALMRFPQSSGTELILPVKDVLNRCNPTFFQALQKWSHQPKTNNPSSYQMIQSPEKLHTFRKKNLS